MSTQHHTRVLERFGQQAATLDTEAAKAEAQARHLGQLITTGQQQRARVAADVAELERQLRERQNQLAALEEDLAAKQGAFDDAQGDAGDYRAEADAVRAIVSREVAVLEQQQSADRLVASAGAAVTSMDPVLPPGVAPVAGNGEVAQP